MYRIAIEGTNAQIQEICNVLKERGLQVGPCNCLHEAILTNFAKKEKIMPITSLLGYNDIKEIFSYKDKDLFIALACMKEDSAFHKWESVIFTGEYGPSITPMWSKEIVGRLFTVKDINYGIHVVERINGSLVSNFEQSFRKATYEEICNHYRLPKEWCLKVTPESYEVFRKERSLSLIGGYITSEPYQGKSWGVWANKPFGTEITIEQFKRHIMEKQIYGYKFTAKEFVKAACIIEGYQTCGHSTMNRIFTLSRDEQAITKWKNADVLDKWFEPVYKGETKTLTYNAGTVEVEVTKDYIYIPEFEATITKKEIEEIEKTLFSSYDLVTAKETWAMKVYAGRISIGCKSGFDFEEIKKLINEIK